MWGCEGEGAGREDVDLLAAGDGDGLVVEVPGGGGVSWWLDWGMGMGIGWGWGTYQAIITDDYGLVSWGTFAFGGDARWTVGGGAAAEVEAA